MEHFNLRGFLSHNWQAPVREYTKDTFREVVREVVDTTVRNFIVGPPERLFHSLKSTLDGRLRYILPAATSIKIVEEDENMQLVRYIHEEPNDIIQFEIAMAVPVKYLVIHLNMETVDERLGLKFVPADGSGNASSPDPREPPDGEGT